MPGLDMPGMALPTAPAVANAAPAASLAAATAIATPTVTVTTPIPTGSTAVAPIDASTASATLLTPPVVAGGALAATDATAAVAQLLPVLQSVVSVITVLVSVLQAQYGAGAIAGGVATPSGGCDTPPAIGAPGGQASVAPSTNSASAPAATTAPPLAPAPAPTPPPPVVAAPVAASAPATGTVAPPATSTNVVMPSALGDPASTAPAATASAGGGGGAAAAPAPTTAAAAAAEPQGIAATFDTRRLFGTPTPGGLLDTVIKAAKTTAPMAMSEGVWTWMKDAAGDAQLQLHLHGKWASSQVGLEAAIANGTAAVHLHPDGTLHVHDVAM